MRLLGFRPISQRPTMLQPSGLYSLIYLRVLNTSYLSVLLTLQSLQAGHWSCCQGMLHCPGISIDDTKAIWTSAFLHNLHKLMDIFFISTSNQVSEKRCPFLFNFRCANFIQTYSCQFWSDVISHFCVYKCPPGFANRPGFDECPKIHRHENLLANVSKALRRY